MNDIERLFNEFRTLLGGMKELQEITDKAEKILRHKHYDLLRAVTKELIHYSFPIDLHVSLEELLSENWHLDQRVVNALQRAIPFRFDSRWLFQLDDEDLAEELAHVRDIGEKRIAQILEGRRRAGHAPDQRNSN